MNVLITGSRGFLGGHITNYFKSKYNVFIPSRGELDLLNLDAVTEYLNLNHIDVVIHCALTGREDLNSTNPEYFLDGLTMFKNLWLNRKKFKKLINLGTMYECDQFKNLYALKEYDFLNFLPQTSYGLSKNLIARIIKDTDSFYNLRLFGVFHESESNKRFFKKVIYQNQIEIFNDQYLDYIYVPDIMPMIETIIEDRAQHKFINMVYPQKYKLSELAYMLCDHLKISKDKIKILGCNGHHLTGNSQRLASYNFKLIGIEQGIKNYTL